MSKQNLHTILFVQAGAIAFAVLFVGQSLGVNALLFAVLLVSSWVYTSPSILAKPNILLSLIGWLFSAFWAMWYGSDMAAFAYWVSMCVAAGFIQQPLLRSLPYALPTSLMSLAYMPYHLGKFIPMPKGYEREMKATWYYTKISVLPLLFLSVFYWIYQSPNPVFANLSTDLLGWIGEQLFTALSYFDTLTLLSLVLGACLTGWGMVRTQQQWFARAEYPLSEQIVRKKRAKPSPAQRKNTLPQRMNALPKAYSRALFLLVSVNILIGAANTTEITFVWFSFEYRPGMNLSQWVHEGTYLLIFSILLSMGILMGYFRRNLNFYHKAPILRQLAYAWIIQNAVMVASVAIRNSHYIIANGLTYKRIGVFLFLGMTLFGLFTLYLKIRDQKSAFYLWRANSWAAYALMLCMAAVNWDVWIAQHNVGREKVGASGVDYLLSLSDKALPIIDQRPDMFIKGKYYEDNLWGFDSNMPLQTEYFAQRVAEFQQAEMEKSWQSWNMADWQAKQYWEGKNWRTSNSAALQFP